MVYMVYYLAIKWSKILIYVIWWINLENIMLIEKTNHLIPGWFLLYEMFRISTFIETENSWGFSGVEEKRK